MSKVAFITGGAKRIGRDLAIFLAGNGYNIALHYNRSLDDAQKVAEIITMKTKRRCEIFQADLSINTEYKKLIDEVYKQFPTCDILINNASIFKKIAFEDTTEDLFDENMNIHVKSAFFLSQSFAKYYKKGLIVNMLDTDVVKHFAQYFIYSITKKSLRDLTQMLAKVLAPDIRVNGICPGPILELQGYDGDYLADEAKKLPLKMKGNTHYIRLALKYLLDNDFVTGEMLFVDGGKHLV